MKILFFVGTEIGGQNGAIGGDISQVIGFINGFKKLGHDVVYASINPKKYLDDKEYSIECIPDYTSPIPKIRGIVNQWNIMKTVDSLVAKHKPSLIYCFWPYNVFISRLEKYKIPIVMVCNIPWSMGNNSFIESFYDKQNLRYTTLVSAVSDDMTEFLNTRYGSRSGYKVITNPNGVDTEKFSQQPKDIREKFGIDSTIPVIGFAGYFSPWHRIDIMIEAVQDLQKDVKLLLIGHGSPQLEHELRSLAVKKNKDRILFTGPVPFSEIPTYYSSCDILVVNQDRNRPLGSSMKLYEYMSMGKAIAAANVGQLAHVIRHRENGVLFDAETESLRNTLEMLLAEPELRERIGKQARKEAVEKHSWEANIQRMLSALNSRVDNRILN